MSLISLVNATDLDSWAKRRDSQAILPQLVRRLAYGRNGEVRARFPSGEGIAFKGWDGIVTSEGAREYVPTGLSGWELSTEGRPTRKANRDYETRKGDPQGLDPRKTTFVFVTPRSWPGKEDWIKQKEAEEFWSEVRAYDAHDLEGWLELTPAVHDWISRLLGKHPEDAISLESFWTDWAQTTRPMISPALVLSGRADIATQIQAWLRDPTSPLVIQGESRDEAIAVVASALEQLDSEERLHYFSRALVVRSAPAWEHLACFTESLILIPLFDCRDVLSRAVGSGHGVIIPLGRADSASDATLQVPRLSLDEATKALIASGFTEKHARTLAQLARKSLMSFRRKLAISREVQQPEWARPENARSLIPIMLVGSWRDSNDNDRQAITAIAGRPYDEVRDTLIRWTNVADPPVRHVGDSWYLVSAEDIWSLLSRYLQYDDLLRFEKTAMDVLGEVDPRFDLPEDERWMANVRGKTPRYSGLLRHSVADILALLGARGETPTFQHGITAASFADRIVRALLERANADWLLWASLSDLLSSLAEAAPPAFLSGVEDGLAGDEPCLIHLFFQGNPLNASSPHTGLLWSLEVLAWSPDYLGQAAHALAWLAEIDPGGKTLNRPHYSLRRIFLPWCPQTLASYEERLSVIDALRTRHPEASWRVLANLLPSLNDTTDPTATPRFRERQVESPAVTWTEYGNAVREIVSRMLADVGTSGTRWEFMINALGTLPLKEYRAVVKRLDKIDPEMMPSVDRTRLSDALRKTVSFHRSHPDARWALPKNSVDKLARLLKRFEPQELIGRFGWLFTHGPSLPEGRIRDLEAQDEAIAALRLRAVESVHSSGGFQGLIEFARGVTVPYCVGLTLGRSELLKQEEHELLEANLVSQVSELADLSRGFVMGRIMAQGRAWVDETFKAIGARLSPSQHTAILLCARADGITWDTARRLGPETEREYWRAVGGSAVRDEADLARAVHSLIQYGRPFASIEALSFGSSRAKEPPTALIAEALELVLGTSPDGDKPGSDLVHDLSQLLHILEESTEVEEGRVAALEWGFLPILRHWNHVPRKLHRELDRNPDFFADIVGFVYRSGNEDERQPSEGERLRAQQGSELLSSWRRVPGSLPEGGIDECKLTEWVDRARARMAADGRAAIGDWLIGTVLSGAPLGSDGVWPHEAVRELLEKASSTDLERGVENGLFNSRGAVTKSLTEGGKQEHEIAAKYTNFAAMTKSRWPRTSAMLRRVTNTYRGFGKGEDQAADVRQELGSGLLDSYR